MATETLDGTIDPAEPVRNKRGYAVFDTLRFRDRNGTQRSLPKICSGGEVTDLLRQGGSGRFYLSSGGGQTGIHGIRLDNGTAAYAHYNTMELVLLIGAIAGLAAVAIALFTGKIMLTPIVLGALLAGAYAYLRGIRIAAKRQYDSDPART